MNNIFSERKNIFIGVGVVFTLITIVTIFVFKASGSNTSRNISSCTPYNIVIEKGERDYTANISWMTKGECTGFITYSNEQNSLNRVGVDIENGVKAKSHIVVLESLVTSDTYYFSIVSDSQNYGNQGLPISFSLSSL